MNATDMIQSYFDPDAVALLAQAAGLEPEVAGRVLEAGLPLQLRALADSAQTPAGELLIANAVESLPPFDSVGVVLEESGGAANLQQAGELLFPALLGEAAQGLPTEVAVQTSADPAGVQTLLQMALPLLLSALGQRGMKAGNISPMLLGLGSVAVTDTVLADTAPAGATPAPPDSAVEKAAPETAPLDLDPSTSGGLLKYLQARFGGSVGQQIGAVAGFGGGVRRQAALAALPVVLAALVGRAQAGGNLQTLAAPFSPLTGEDGHLKADLLDSPVEVARIEGQGRGLLVSLFGDVNAVTGRLGSALGGSGDSSRRLLALLTPLVLSALTRAHPDGIGALPLGALAADSAGGLKAMLPSGFSSLGVLIGSLVSGAPLPGTVVTATPRAIIKQGAPVAAARPSPLKPSRPASARAAPPPSPPPVRRRGFPWWIIPLLLLLLGGGWVLQNRSVVPGGGTTAGAARATFTNPQSGAAVPADGFTLRGTGPASETLSVLQGGNEIGTTTVDPGGMWSLETGSAASQGPQTYSLRDGAGQELASLDVVVGGGGSGTTATPAITPPALQDPEEASPVETGGAEDDVSDPPAPDDTALDDTDPDVSVPEASAPVVKNSDNTVPDNTSGAEISPATPAPSTPTLSTPNTGGSAAAGAAAARAASAAPVVITAPQNGARVPAGGLTLRGTGPAGETLELFHSGLRAGDVTVRANGTWKAVIMAGAAPPGPQRYDLRDAAGQVRARVRVQVAPKVQPAPETGNTPGAENASEVRGTPQPQSEPDNARTLAEAEAVSSPGSASVDRPASGAKVSAVGFTLVGTGTAGQTFEVTENGVSVGSFTVGADSTWERPVTGPALGAKTYVIQAARGQVVASVPLTVVTPSDSAQEADCTQALSVSLQDGETLTAPYRFAGLGNASGYSVTAKRGERFLGRKTALLGVGCTWSFISNPAPRPGQTVQITYEVRPVGVPLDEAPAISLTLNVQ